MNVHRHSKYIFGRDKDLADIRLNHQTCSSVHAVLQYRLRAESSGRHICPYLIDLDSTYGTFINHRRIQAHSYHKLEENDIIQFGQSSKEYSLFIESDSTQK